MAVVFIEKPNREGDSSAKDGSGRWEYVARVTGTATPELDLINAVIADTGFFWYNLALKKVGFQELGNDLYSATVEWGAEIPDTAAQDPSVTPGGSDGPGGGSPSGTPSGPSADTDRVGANLTLEIGGRPPKLLTTLATLSSGGFGLPVPPGAVVDAPDYQGGINVNESGEVDGVEIDDPGVVLTLDYKFDRCSWRYVRRLMGLVWKVNDDTWRTFNRREAAFMGATLKTGDDARASITFRFGMRPETTIAAGKLRDDGTNKLPQAAVTFRGWDFLWVKYEKEASNNRTVSRPKFYFVEQVLEEADFSTIGIGG